MICETTAELELGDDEEPMGSFVLDVTGLRDNTTLAWRRRLVAGAHRLGLDPSLVAAVMSFETGGTFNPQVRAGKNPNAAVGLIQWTKTGAASQGFTKTQIAAMSADRQLDLALDWFGRHADRLHRSCDYYLAVFWPNAIGWSLGRTLPMSAAQVAANKGLDRNQDGTITVFEACSGLNARLRDAQTRPMVWVPGGELIAGAAALATLALGAYLERGSVLR